MLDELLKPDKELRQRNFHEFESRYGFTLYVDSDETARYQMRKSAFGEPVAYICVGNSEWVRMNSSYNPSYEAVRWSLDVSDDCRRCAVAMYGISTGVYLKALMSSFRPDARYFVYEPFEDFFSFMCAYVDFTAIIRDPQVQIYLRKEQKSDYYRDVYKELVQFNSELKVLVTPQYQFPRDFIEICESLIRDRNMKKSYLKLIARQALRARLYAWNHMRRGYLFPELAKMIPEGIPAVIVSAGPSLEQNVEVLKRIKGHALIVCTDRAVSILDLHDITPDLIVSVDSTKSADFLKYKIVQNVPLLASYQVNIDIQKLFADNIIYFQGLVFEYGLIGEHSGATVGGLDYGGNVAGAAFCACRDLGIKTIVLVGQDLAYIDGKHHADNVKSDVTDMDVLTVEGIDGTPVKTNSMWISFRDFFEREIRGHQELKVIDATEGGALIRGTKILKLSEVADEFCQNYYSPEIDLSNISKAQNFEEYTKTKSMLEVWLKVLDIFVNNAKEIVEVCDLFFESISKSDVKDEYNQKLIAYLKELREEIFSSVVNFMMEELWIENTDSIPDHEIIIRSNDEGKIIIGREKEYFTAFRKDCADLKKELVAAINEGIADNA